MFDHDDGHGNKVLAINEGKQAVNQLIASVLTFVIAITGGGLTGNLYNLIISKIVGDAIKILKLHVKINNPLLGFINCN